MKKIHFLIIPFLIAVFLTRTSFALNFEEALSSAYNNNPYLKAAREDLKATDEQMPQAVSGFLPQISANAQRGERETTQAGTSTDRIVDTKEIAINQPLFRGGQTYNNIKLAKNAIFAAREELRQIEQEVLLEAITAYMDIIRDQEVLELSKNNVEVLKKHLEVTKERFNLGEVTKTDVAQAESGLAVAKSEMISADGILESSKARFIRIVGERPGILKPSRRPATLNLSLDEIIQIAMGENPTILSAKYNEMAAKKQSFS
jgi:outer membrane protein